MQEITIKLEPLIVYSPRCAACVDYRRFVSEYLERGQNDGQA